MAWYSDSDNVRELGKALVNAEVLEDTEDFAEFLGKPRKYTEHYNAWSEASFPSDENDDGWEEFVEAVSSDDEEDESDET